MYIPQYSAYRNIYTHKHTPSAAADATRFGESEQESVRTRDTSVNDKTETRYVTEFSSKQRPDQSNNAANLLGQLDPKDEKPRLL